MNHKKHITSWFTTSDYRCINLEWVTDIIMQKDGDTVLGAFVYQGVGSSEGQHSIRVSKADAVKLFDLLT